MKVVNTPRILNSSTRLGIMVIHIIKQHYICKTYNIATLVRLNIY